MTRAVLVAIALLGGCIPATYDCNDDLECTGGQLCSRTHECSAPIELRSARITWTLEGQLDTQTGCRTLGLADLTIQFTAGDGQELSYTPVPCSGGVYYIDKLPTRFYQVDLSGFAPGRTYAGATIMGDATDYAITLVEEQ